MHLCVIDIILPFSTILIFDFGVFVGQDGIFCFFSFYCNIYIFSVHIRVITKLPNTDQSYKGKVKTHKSINRQNQSTTGKLGKLQWPWLGTGISQEMVD